MLSRGLGLGWASMGALSKATSQGECLLCARHWARGLDVILLQS